MGKISYIYKLLPLIYKKKIDLVLLCGNTLSLQIINTLYENKVPFKGITGNLDDHSIIKLLKDTNSYLDGRVVEYKGYIIAGVGVQIGNNIERIKSTDPKRLDLLVTFYPPLKHTLKLLGLSIGSDLVDQLINEIHITLILVCKPIGRYGVHGNIVYLRPLYKGYYAIINLYNDIFNVEEKYILQ